MRRAACVGSCIEEINFLYRLYKPVCKSKTLLAAAAAMPLNALCSI
jgi:hypothetical protein